MFFYILWYFIQGWIGIYLLLPFLFLVIYLVRKALGIRFDIEKKQIKIRKDFHFAALITAHKETLLIPPLVDSLVRQNYGHITIYVIADACDISGLKFDDPRVVILKPETDLNSKIKSIDYAIRHFVKDHDALVIFDSDNLVHPGYFSVLNKYFQRGYRAVQTNLQPKNTDSLYARLDSIGDVFYNFTEREIRMELGFSSAIWGLGIAVDTRLYKEIIYDHFLGGFDKRVQADIVRKIPQLAFAREALVYDEKVSDGKSLEKQRTRWINAYFKYISLAFAVIADGIRKLSANLIFFGFINLRPPLFLTMALAFLFCIINFFTHTTLFYLWLALIVLFFLSFFLIVTIKSRDRRIAKSMLFMPLFVLRQVLAFLKISRASKSFLKTEHHKVVRIDDLLKNEPV